MPSEGYRSIPLEVAISASTPVSVLKPCNTCELVPTSCGNQISVKDGGVDGTAYCVKKGPITMRLSEIPQRNGGS